MSVTTRRRLDAATGAAFVVLIAVALFAERGPFLLGGVIDVGGAIPALLWIAALSLVMMRSVSAPGAHAIARRTP